MTNTIESLDHILSNSIEKEITLVTDKDILDDYDCLISRLCYKGMISEESFFYLDGVLYGAYRSLMYPELEIKYGKVRYCNNAVCFGLELK